MSRFSKIGGEMVPHIAIEEQIIEQLGRTGQPIVVTAAPDEKKGEQLVVLYTESSLDHESLVSAIKDCDMPNLWRPRKMNLIPVEHLPALGTGKLDLKDVRRIAREYVENQPGAFERAIGKLRKAL